MSNLLKEMKYTSAYLIPLCCFIGFYFGGVYTWLTIVFSFIFTPILDAFLPTTEEVSESNNKEYSKLYDWFLYLNLLWVFGLVIYGALQWESHSYTRMENIGLIISLGLVLGTSGINVAHELGHRVEKKEQLMAQALLLPTFYMHFFIEHNRGHHANVATPLDPATAQRGEYLYSFWFKTVVFSYVSAWKIQLKMLKGQFFSFKNSMLWYHIIYVVYIFSILYMFNSQVLMYCVIAGIVGFLLLETINYVEHYGLQRKLLPNGKYERVQLHHSWNANYTFGRIILFELTRHSDHHFKASKKYHTLEHQTSAPELPFGYPTAILCSLVPWLWFWVMDKRLT
ncbi:alkane 1-monooxygenase [Flammeovirga sp. EKP202]|uniref:alkane 1-monooxygenase n=1 Tax=Flammeovirga sp. EKP202 TaxID=2770592 RepID=UPI00165FAB97|nr:alkane 1-monooxygenase [Flammeovirga sp. EKP202]MBD0400809.1 alkane 1-monooxygenase [Flammeovirga sp. EKP202]